MALGNMKMPVLVLLAGLKEGFFKFVRCRSGADLGEERLEDERARTAFFPQTDRSWHFSLVQLRISLFEKNWDAISLSSI
jgi:hypothetical protein